MLYAHTGSHPLPLLLSYLRSHPAQPPFSAPLTSLLASLCSTSFVRNTRIHPRFHWPHCTTHFTSPPSTAAPLHPHRRKRLSQSSPQFSSPTRVSFPPHLSSSLVRAAPRIAPVKKKEEQTGKLKVDPHLCCHACLLSSSSIFVRRASLVFSIFLSFLLQLVSTTTCQARSSRRRPLSGFSADPFPPLISTTGSFQSSFSTSSLCLTHTLQETVAN